MRRKKTILPLLAAVGGISSAAFAAPPAFYDSFNYANGTNGLAGNTNAGVQPSITVNGTQFDSYNAWTSTSSHGPDVVSGDLSYTGLPTGTDGHAAQLDGSGSGISFDRVGTGEYAAGQTIYFSLLVQVSSISGDAGGTGTNGGFFTGLQYNPSTSTANSITDPTPNMSSAYSGSGALLLIRNNGSNQYQFGTGFRDIPITSGVDAGTGNAVLGNARVFAPQLFNVGDTVLLVGKWVRNPGTQDDVASLFVDPNPIGSEPASADAVSDASVVLAGSSTNYDYGYESANTGPDPGTLVDDSIRSFILRNNATEPLHMLVDDVRIGTNWAEVTHEPGDADLNGKVDSADFDILAGNFGKSGATWTDGDFNGDGIVNALDFNALATNYGYGASGAAVLASFGAATVPEPASIALLGVAALGLMAKRRRGKNGRCVGPATPGIESERPPQ